MERISFAHEVEETFVCLFLCLFKLHLKSFSVTEATEERKTG